MSARTIFCRFCGAAAAHRYGQDRRRRQRYKCAACHKIFTNRTNTPHSGSHLSDSEWHLAERLFASRVGMSGVDLGNILGYGRRTGQRLNRAFRKTVQRLTPHVLPGPSEWDETLPLKDQWVLGGYSRVIRRCVLTIIPRRTEDILVPAIEAVTDGQGPVFTDEWGGYLRLMNHWTVNHSKGFINRDARFVHTNSVEGIWGHLKPLGHHVYRGFKRRTLSEFLAEFMFRYNLPDYETRLAVLSALLRRPKTNSLVV